MNRSHDWHLAKACAFLLALGAAVFLLSSCGKVDPLDYPRATLEQAMTLEGVETTGETLIVFYDGTIEGGSDGRTWCFVDGHECNVILETWEPIVVLHEIGHAMGLKHSDDKTSAMYSAANVAMSPEEAATEIALLCKVHGCRKPIYALP